jgi:hypothetical protein
VNCHDYPSFEKVIESVANLDQDDEAYAHVYEAPFLRRSMMGYTFEPGFEEFLLHIFSQEKDSAFRRNRQFWGKAYETKSRKFAHYITRLENKPLFSLREHLRMMGILGTIRKSTEKIEIKKREREEARLRDE